MQSNDEFDQRQKLAKLDEAEAQLQQRLADLKRQKKAAKQHIRQKTKHENWHRQKLAYSDRLAGLTGEMADARHYLRQMNLNDYFAQLAKHVTDPERDTLAKLERIAVEINLDEWNRRGAQLLLNRARAVYLRKAASFADWQLANPDKTNWRSATMTREQKFLILRICEAKNCPLPGKMRRGEAHDWIAASGGNPRLGETQG